MTFSIQRKSNDSSTVWEEYPGVPVFPLSIGTFLDEQLDEAYVTVYNGEDKTMTPRTPIRIKEQEDSDASTRYRYMIVANDERTEFPTGSGRYKHVLYLLELTKALEGIVCESLSFTNALGREYTDGSASAYPEYQEEGAFTNIPDDPIFISSIVSPMERGKEYSFGTISEIGQSVANQYKESAGYYEVNYIEQWYLDGINASSKVVISNAGVVTEYTADHVGEIKSAPSNPFTITCYIPITFRAGIGSNLAYGGIKIIYTPYIVNNIAPLKKWTVASAATRVLELAEPIYLGQTPKYRLQGAQYSSSGVFQGYSAGSLGAKLDAVYCPDFTLTECTLREQLKTIFGFYQNAEPRLLDGGIISCDFQADREPAKINGKPYFYKNEKQDINNYATAIRSNAQNLLNTIGSSRGVITDPADGQFRSLRTETQYARITEENGFIYTEYPVYEVYDVQCGIDNGDKQLPARSIGKYLFEKNEYYLLSSYNGDFPKSKAYGIYYTQGSNNIGGLFFKVESPIHPIFSNYAIVNILAAVNGMSAENVDKMLATTSGNKYAGLYFTVTYKPIYSAVVEQKKPKYIKNADSFVQPYNQGENIIETTFYGENMKGVIARIGNADQTRTYIFRRNSQIPKIGQTLDGYVISAVMTEAYPTYYKTTLTLSKEFNRISPYIGINSTKRLYQVSEREAYARNILLTETLMIDDGRNKERFPVLFKNLDGIRQAFVQEDGFVRPTQAFIRTERDGDPADISQIIALPVTVTALGNAIVFSFKFKDNYSAGSQSKYETKGEISGNFQEDVPYSDYYGRAKYLRFSVGKAFQNIDPIDKFSTPLLANINFASAFVDTNKPILTTSPYLFRKDSREIPQINICLNIQTSLDDLIIGSGISNRCGWCNVEKTEPAHLYYNISADPFTPFERIRTDLSGLLDMGVVSCTSNNNVLQLTCPGENGDTHTALGWCVMIPPTQSTRTVYDEDTGHETTETTYNGGDIMLASNKPKKVGDGSVLNLSIYAIKN